MQPNESIDPIEPVTGQPYTPNTQPIILNTQQAAPQAPPAMPQAPPAMPQAPPAVPQAPPTVQNIQTETHSAQAESHPARRIVSVLFGAVEIILAARLILKLLGANAGNSIIKVLYGTTGFFVKLFEGIFSRVTINEASGAVFEPATLIAMVVIALIAWGVLKLMKSRTGSRVVKTEYSGPAGQNGQQK